MNPSAPTQPRYSVATPALAHPAHPSDIKSVAVIGAGAIGGWLALKLHQSGVAVTVLARGATLAALQKDGLHLLSNAEQTNAVDIGQSTKSVLESSKTFDLIVVAVKAPAMRAVAAEIAPLLHASSMVLSAMNGVPWWFMQGFGGQHAGAVLQSVDARGEIAALIPAHQILGAVVHASLSTSAPGRVVHHFGNGLIVGDPQSPGGVPTPRAQAVAALFANAGIDATASAHIQRDIWYKLWGNMTMNPISAITGATADKVLADDLVRGFTTAVMLEAKAIGEQIGLPIAQVPEDRHAITAKLGAFKTSMLQDVQAGRAIELDAMLGAVRELGCVVGVATPHTDALLGLTRLMARERGLYPPA
jgi:2-dehydropantoate 2-reductase